jgi:hypothetical protein
VRYSCTASFLEIYNEVITDLLEPAATKLEIRESARTGCYVEGLSSHTVLTGACAWAPRLGLGLRRLAVGLPRPWPGAHGTLLLAVQPC